MKHSKKKRDAVEIFYFIGLKKERAELAFKRYLFLRKIPVIVSLGMVAMGTTDSVLNMLFQITMFKINNNWWLIPIGLFFLFNENLKSQKEEHEKSYKKMNFLYSKANKITKQWGSELTANTNDLSLLKEIEKQVEKVNLPLLSKWTGWKAKRKFFKRQEHDWLKGFLEKSSEEVLYYRKINRYILIVFFTLIGSLILWSRY